MKNLFFIPLIILIGCVPVSQTSNNNFTADQLILDDHIYESQIHSARIFPISGSRTEAVLPAVAQIDQPTNLLLQFDDLAEEVDNYYARIVHCNADWSKSLLTDLEYMIDFNEFSIDQYEYSFNTKIPYVSYNFRLPRVKIPGNYLVVVYRGMEKDDLVLSKRFIVVGNTIEIASKAGTSLGVAERMSHQQIEFTLNYSNYEVLNPNQDIKVVLRKNQKWFNAITNLKPTLIREDLSQLVYQHFNLENNFMAGNEYRYFDLRSVSFLGINVGDITSEGGKINAFLLKDKPRTGAYSIYNDINGKYILENVEPQKTYMESEYVNVHFFLEMAEPLKEDVYIMGELTNWNFNQSNKMTYDAVLKGYTGSLLLRQGWYNYLYYVPKAQNPFIIEGNHYETENLYEIIVYHRPMGSRADMIVGYKRINLKI